MHYVFKHCSKYKAQRKYLAGEQVDDLKAVLDDPDGHQLLAVVTSVHHQGVDL